MFVRQLLRSLGFHSEIYCGDIAAGLESEFLPAPMFCDSADTVLLIHFSWATKFDRWLSRLKCRKILVYHNITPDDFFVEGDWFAQTARLSRRQLAGFSSSVDASLAQSAYSTRELADLGFAQPAVLPLLFDPASWREQPFDKASWRALRADDAYKILFVGRIVRNKCQHELLAVVDRLRHMTTRSVRLILVGGVGADAAYDEDLRARCDELGLAECVELAGKVDDRRLRALYRGCDAFLCLSEHEGFCVPVIEAMQFDLPVVAYASSALSETVGTGGLLMKDKEPGRVAAVLKVLSEEPALRRRLVRQGRHNLDRFSRARSLHGLAEFLRERAAVEIPNPPPAPQSAGQAKCWRIEGPFDSSYSLALVNRSLAQALAEQGVDVGLHATEGDGDYVPDPCFLTAAPRVAELWRHGQATPMPDVCLRNLYPPRVSDMAGETRVLSNWGWEESGLPASWVARFNASLDLVTTVSRFVAKTLMDNGVKVPITVVGNGCEHLQTATAGQPADSLPRDETFRFLYVSSGFPRKGIDALLEAWGRAFSKSDRVTLVLKTFPNPHNQVAEQVEALASRFPEHAEIVVIDREVSAEELQALYRSAQAYVAPARGEGFALPVAEAMLHDLPVIATAHGGMRELCLPQTAWLVDYRFAYADTHFRQFNSVWAEPEVDDLVRAMREVRAALPSERHARTTAARRRVERLFTWPAVARRTRDAIAALDNQTVPVPLPHIAWITSWNTRCGIASYARMLAKAIPVGHLHVLASQAGEWLSEDEPFVERCWKQGGADDLDGLYRAVHRVGASVAVIQFNFSFFRFDAFARLLDRLHADGVDCWVMMHSTRDVDLPDIQQSLSSIADSLGRAKRLLVHGVADLNILKGFDLVDNVALFPHGVLLPVPADAVCSRAALGLEGKTVIATFGYLLPDKGLPVLIEAFARLRQGRSDLHLLMLNALYPVPSSESEAERCRMTIVQYDQGEAVTMVTEYLPDEQAQALLQIADLVVYSYQHTQESASGAIRFGIASGRPVACTPLPIFDDVARLVHPLPGTSADDLARGLSALLGDPAALQSRQTEQAAFIEACNWPLLSDRLWNMLRAPPILDLVEADEREEAALDIALPAPSGSAMGWG
jgi:glycosyltransferase involved in cell wall biosynthesis